MKKKLLSVLLCLSAVASQAFAWMPAGGNRGDLSDLEWVFGRENQHVLGKAQYQCPVRSAEMPTYVRVTVEPRGPDANRPGAMWIAMVTQSGIPAMDQAVATGKLPNNQYVPIHARIYFVDQSLQLVEFTGQTTPPPVAVDRLELRDEQEALFPITGNSDGEIRAIYVGYGVATAEMLRNFESRRKGIERSNEIAAQRGLDARRPDAQMIMDSHMMTMIQRDMLESLRMVKVAELTNRKCLDLALQGYLGGWAP